MSDSVKARPDLYGQLVTRVDAKRLKRNEPLAQYTTFKIGGPADLFYDATSTDDLAGAVTAARDLGIEYFVLGLGANILVGDKGFRGLVIRNTSHHIKFLDGGKLWVGTENPMTKIGANLWRVGKEDWSPERASFADFVDGRPQTLIWSGEKFARHDV